MANNDSTQTTIAGVASIDGATIEQFATIAGTHAEDMSTLFRTIARLTDDREIVGICAHGALACDLHANDIEQLEEQLAA